MCKIDHEKLFSNAMKLAQQGDSKAQFIVGKYYEVGEPDMWSLVKALFSDSPIPVIVDQNSTLAIEWYTKSADQGNSDAQRNLATMYYNGKGVAQDYKKAFDLFYKAAQKGDACAQYWLGLCYQQGKGIAQDNKLAVEWYTQSADQENSDAQRCLAMMYYNGEGEQNYEKAFELFSKAAYKGDAYAQYRVGLCYDQGEGIVKNYQLAAEWYTKSADQENSDAQRNLGRLYHFGNGVRKNYTKAFQFFLKSAERGDAYAQWRVGEYYEQGKGVLQNYTLAVEWYTRSASQGNTNAQYRLGWLYYDGEKIKKNYTIAFELFEKIAQKGDANAQNILGVMYLKGHGVEKSKTMAFEWFLKSAEQGDQWAQCNLKFSCNQKQEENQKFAFKWLQKSAGQGNATALYELAKMYYYGRGTMKDCQLAFSCAALSLEHGNSQAIRLLANIYLGNGLENNRLSFKLTEATASKAYHYGKHLQKWFFRDAEKGDAIAQYNLAVMYRLGGFYTQRKLDEEAAFKWFFQSAEQGDLDAEYMVGLCYERGRGVTQNYMLAVEWYTKSANQNHLIGERNLAEMYYNGRGVDQNREKAFELFYKAANSGDATAQYIIGKIYYDGKVVAKDYFKAQEWLSKAANQEHKEAISLLHIVEEMIDWWYTRRADHGDFEDRNDLALMYYEGVIVEQNYEKAFQLWIEAAHQDDAVAQFRIGVCYCKGESVTQDYKLAAEWYAKSVNQNYSPAQHDLAILYYWGRGVDQDYKKAFDLFNMAINNGDENAQEWVGVCYYFGYGIEKSYKKAKEWLVKAMELDAKRSNEYWSDLSFQTKLVGGEMPRVFVLSSLSETLLDLIHKREQPVPKSIVWTVQNNGEGIVKCQHFPGNIGINVDYLKKTQIISDISIITVYDSTFSSVIKDFTVDMAISEMGERFKNKTLKELNDFLLFCYYDFFFASSDDELVDIIRKYFAPRCILNIRDKIK